MLYPDASALSPPSLGAAERDGIGRVLTGLCGKSSADKTGCAKESGFGAAGPARGDRTMRQCALRCLACEGCAYATFSARQSDCSLYRTCDATELFVHGNYRTAHVTGTTEDTWRGVELRRPPESSSAHPAPALSPSGSPRKGGSQS
jgi:hypothetical protein